MIAKTVTYCKQNKVKTVNGLPLCFAVCNGFYYMACELFENNPMKAYIFAFPAVYKLRGYFIMIGLLCFVYLYTAPINKIDLLQL